MNDREKVRVLQQQREDMRQELQGIRRTLEKMAADVEGINRKGWMPIAMLDWMEERIARSPEQEDDEGRRELDEMAPGERARYVATIKRKGGA